jgi:hypothetical protein
MALLSKKGWSEERVGWGCVRIDRLDGIGLCGVGRETPSGSHMKKTACPTCMLPRSEGSKTLTGDLLLRKVTN